MCDDRRLAVVEVRGARVHNLKSVDVDLPRDRLVVVTGVSGSGKSSLAFGTVYAEAQRRYLESISPYARRLIEQAGTPEVDRIDGLPPAVALQQSRGVPSARSTVGTITTLSNTMRMLLSRAGTYPEGASRLDSDAFSTNTPAGACPACHGLGLVHEATEASLVPDPTLSVRDGAIAAWPGAWQGKNYRDILTTLGYDVDRPWHELAQSDRDWILFTDEQPVVTVHAQREAHRIQRPYQGTYQSARRYVLHTLASTSSATLRRRALRHVETRPCPTCDGTGLRPEALAVTFAGRSIAELGALPLSELAEALRGDGGAVAAAIVPEVIARVAVLGELGLGHLTLARRTPTLSSGELQRLRLATALHSALFGVVYVLDEPSAGLHPVDVDRLLTVLDRLRGAGNSLLVVEHDLEMMRRADWLVDVGPGAGTRGGRIVHSGPVDRLAGVPESQTRPYLFGDEPRYDRPRRQPNGTVRMRGITRNNLRGFSVEVPLGVLVAVTGVSGSGKSTLIDTLTDALRDRLGQDPAVEEDDEPAAPRLTAGDVEGLDAIDRLVQVDQRPIGRTPRSNLATYTGLFDGVRALFAATDEAKRRSYPVGRFSFNVAGGRCETCQGEGFVAVELLFLPGTYSPCPVCHGTRYAPETLEIRYRDRSVADVLAMTVESAAEFFADDPAKPAAGVSRSLRTLLEVGLGYLALGQPATELSGGEAQRIKLATELQRARRGRTLYVLDEPTTGLHPADVARLTALLHALVDAGNSVVLVEHDMSVVASADHVLDIGPGGGDAGGRLVAAGSPEQVASADGATSRFLTAELSRISAPVDNGRPTGTP